MAAPAIGTPIVAPAADLPDWARRAIDLANPRLGARTLAVSDDFFAPCERMLNPEPAVFIPGKYDDNGKWMDGWESRRKRVLGHDWAVVQLGRKGRIFGFDIDTSHFTGNYAPAVSIEACQSADTPDGDTLWQEILPAQSLSGNSQHLLRISNDGVWSHLRVHIYPDGGIARLRVYGQPVIDFAALDRSQPIDLAALENGGRAVAWNDAHFGVVQNLILPGRGINMGDGWETRRRREPGNDWCILQLGAPGVVEKIDVDTAFFKGNFPDRCAIQAALVDGGTDQSLVTQSLFWPTLLPEQKLSADSIHHYTEQISRLGAISHIRLNVIPDGGISRLRLWGRPAERS